MDNPRRILLIRPSALGDVCRTVPVLVSLRARFPDAAIDWLVQSEFAEAVKEHPALDRVVPFPRREVSLGRLWRPGALGTLLRFLRSLRGPGYDVVVDAQGLFRSAFFAGCTRAERRIGYANAAEAGWIFLNERHAIPSSLHTVDRMLMLVERAGIPPVRDMRLYTGDAAKARSHELVQSERFVLIAPTSRWPGKRWPSDRFAVLARRLLDDGAADSIAIAGAASERDQCGPLLELAKADPRVIDLVGRTSIAELMAVIERASLVIANDSAALHMAVGFDRPIVALFGPTRIDLVGPYRREHDVIQSAPPGPANRHKDDAAGAAAMHAIPTDTVIEAAIARLSAGGETT